MQCMWNELLSILPQWMRREVDRLGKDKGCELRLRLNQPPELVLDHGSAFLAQCATQTDLDFVVNAASRYSPWSSATAEQGYLTAPGGHRIGLCGVAVIHSGKMTGIRELTALCIRIARDFPGIARAAIQAPGSVLIVGPPGSGKTTLLRDLIRQRSEKGPGSVAVVDERCELFPKGGAAFSQGPRTDVLSGCAKTIGIETMLRTMGPSWIAMDEITSEEDCEALLRAGWCGVSLLATAHASNRSDLFHREIYRKLAQSHLFDWLIVLRPDKSYGTERM